MTGNSNRSATSFCRSRPLTSGRWTSSTIQHGTSIRGCDRNSCAEANILGSQPAPRISSSSDSRTETSSSITKTTGVARESEGLASQAAWLAELFSTVGDSMGQPRLVHSNRGIERLTQGRVAEGLEEACYRALFYQIRAQGLICGSCDEDDRHFSLQTPQLLLKDRSGHPRHSHVEQQAVGLVDAIGREELQRRRERPDRKAQRP